jgi:ATPase family associated with various cellular activities (AAA)
MRRILVTGSTGAGKTTLARVLAGRLGIPFHEMDALAFAGPGWQENQRLVQDVSRISSGPCWIFDSLGYPQVRDLLWTRADTIVWLDYPRSVVMRRVLRRSAARTLLRRRVFNGNAETVASWFSASHPAWWAWAQYAGRRDEIASRCTSPRYAPLDVIHLTTPRAATQWLAAVHGPGRDGTG